jgi:hypothetical protein
MGNIGEFNKVVAETVSLNNLRIIHSMKNVPVICLAISEKIPTFQDISFRSHVWWIYTN